MPTDVSGLLRSLCLVLIPVALCSGAVMEPELSEADSAMATGRLEIAADHDPPQEPRARDLLDLSEVYPGDLPGERLEDQGVDPDWGAGEAPDAGAAIIAALAPTSAPAPPRTPVPFVRTRRPSNVWQAFKSVPPSAVISMLFCLFLLLILMLKGMRP